MENKKLTDGGKYIIKTIFKDKPINEDESVIIEKIDGVKLLVRKP
jgi:hypothetical protein